MAKYTPLPSDPLTNYLALAISYLKDFDGNPALCVVVVYQCSISNVMYTGDIEALFVFGSRCVRLLETHPLLVESIQLLPHPGLDWQVHTHYDIPHIMPLYYLLVGRRMDSVLGVHEHRRGFDRSIDISV